jgi:hypothetical protein
MLKEAKRRALTAHKAACKADSLSAGIYNRWIAITLTAVDGQEEQVAAAMFTRLAIALEVMVDMRGWASGAVQGVTA